LEYTKLERRTEPVLVISHILPGSQAQLSRAINPGALIEELNNHKVTTIETFRSALQESVKTGFLVVKTIDQIVVAFDFKQVIADELRLSEYFDYQLSAVMRAHV
jgi:hypothetical protein